MINPDELVDAVVDALQALPGLVALAGSSAKIAAYEDGDSSLLRGISVMTSPSVLVAWRGMEQGEEGAPIQWRHQVAVYCRAKSGQRFGQYLAAIVNGVPTGETQATFGNPDLVDARFDLIGVPVGTRVTDENNVDYLEVLMTFGQKVEEA